MTEAPAPRRARWGLIIPWAIAGLIMLGWCGYWFVLRQTAISTLTTWSQTQQSAGGPAGFSAIRAEGFPLRMELVLADAAFQSADAGLMAATPLARIAVNPVNPNHTIITLPQAVTYRLHGGAPRVLTAVRLQASMRNQNGRLARFSLEGQGLQAAALGADPSAGLRAESLGVHVQPDPRNAADWQVAARAVNLDVAAPVRGFEDLGQRFETLTIMAVLTKAEALADPGAAADPLLLWTQAGGEARIESSEIVWGPASATSVGAVRLDAQRRLEGQLTLRLQEADTLLAAIGGGGGGGGGGLTALLAQNLEISEVVFTAQDGTLYWQADTPLGEIAPQAVRSLGPVYPATP